MNILALLLPLLLISLCLYAALVLWLSKYKSSWTTRIVRPLVLMLLLAPGYLEGHGFGIVPAGLGFALGADDGDANFFFNHLASWLGFAFFGFLFECVLASSRQPAPKPKPEF